MRGVSQSGHYGEEEFAGWVEGFCQDGWIKRGNTGERAKITEGVKLIAYGIWRTQRKIIVRGVDCYQVRAKKHLKDLWRKRIAVD